MSTPPPSPDPLEPVVPPASPPMVQLVYRPPVEPPRELPVLSHRAMAWAAVALVVLGTGLAVALLLAYGGGGHSDQLDAIKTAGTIVVGAGGAAALWLTARRQRTSELTLNQVRAAHAATVADAEARRITDLYGKAADQLGSPRAPARLAGLYALERVAQDNPAQRQTIVDLLCAYLRMPYDPPRRTPVRRPSGVSRPLLGTAARQRASVRLTPPMPRTDPSDTATETEQEHQVRRTAQAILFRHLLFGAEEEAAAETFWSGISLDLTGALLGPANLIGCRVLAADFTGATFTGDVWFDRARFGLEAVFTGVRFAGDVSFSKARFEHDARFDGATFDDYARFGNADFGAGASFSRAHFRSAALFIGAKFARHAWFVASRFGDRAEFDKVRCSGPGAFDGARFAGSAVFTGAEFGAKTGFLGARFEGATTRFTWATLAGADFHEAEFGPDTDFTEARFTARVWFKLAKFTNGAKFVRAKFEGVDFGEAQFAGFTTFEDAEFGGEASFFRSHFGERTGFERARFAAAARFEGTEFAEGAAFVEARFDRTARFDGTGFDGVCGFPGARFGGDTVFRDVRLGGPVGFVRAEFECPPRIEQVWFRTDGLKLRVDNTFPPDTVLRETSERPDRVDEGRWALLETA